MKFAQFIPLVGSFCNFLLAMFVLARGFNVKANRVYFFLALSIATWNLGSYFLFLVSSNEEALLWARFLQFGVIFIPTLLFHLSLLIAEVPVKRWIYIPYAICAILAFANLTPLYVADVRFLGRSGWYAVAGPAFHFFGGLYTLVVISLVILWRKRRQLSVLHRSKLDALFFAQTLLAIFGCNDILPIIGVETYPGTDIAVYPFGSLAAVFYGLIVGYSVFQHQLLDIQLTLSHIAANAIRFLFFTLIGIVLLLSFTVFFPDAYTGTAFVGSVLVLLASGVISSIYFPRMFGSGTESLERRILGDRFEYHDQIRSFIREMPWYTDVNLLTNDLHNLVTRALGVTSYKIVLIDETRREFTVFRAHPEEAPSEPTNVPFDSPLLAYFRASTSEYLMRKPVPRTSRQPPEFQVHEELSRMNADFAFPFFFSDEPFGLLLLGPKKDASPFTATDISLLISMSKTLALIINQIRLKMQILQAQELDLLGRMSRGMAHDLNNLLTPVHTFLQLTAEVSSSDSLNEELLPVALRNVATMRAYIREALFFSQNLRPDFQLGRLDVLVRSASEIVRDRAAKRNVSIEPKGQDTEARIELDSVLVERLLTNLLSNAVDASPANASISVQLTRLSHNERDREWFRVSIRDQGPGIAKQDLNRIFAPYFTTKKTGDESRGFGLGLAICRKIVNLHGGSLDLTSREGQGTVVTVDLPSRQIKKPAPAVENLE